MNAAEIRRIDEAIARNRAGDRRGVDELLRALKPRPKHPTFEVQQLVLRFMLDATFRCERLDGTFRVRDCLERRGSVWPSGRRKGSPKSRQCVGCGVGAAFARCLPTFKPRPASQPPEVLPLAQRQSKRRLSLAVLGECATMNPLDEAAMMTLDDKDEWRA